MIYVRDIQKLDIMNELGLHLVAGEAGLSRVVTKAAVAETMEFTKWQTGNEFLEFSGFGLELDKSDNMMTVVKNAYEYHIAALAFQIGDEYITEIPPEVIEYANQMGFPIFTLPYDVSFSSFIHPISDLIVRTEMKEKIVQDMVKDMLYSEIGEQFFLDRTEEYGYNFEGKYQVIELTAVSDGVVNNVLNSVNYNIVGNDCPTKTVAYMYAGRLVILTPDYCVCEILDILGRWDDVRIGVGGDYGNPAEWKNSVKEAETALNVSEMNNEKCVKFKNLGFIRLIESGNRDGIEKYVYEILGAVIELDRQGTVSYIKTLNAYVESNFSIAETSRKLFIHRNTLIHRIEKIREVINTDFDNATVRRELANALYLYKVFIGYFNQ